MIQTQELELATVAETDRETGVQTVEYIQQARPESRVLAMAASAVVVVVTAAAVACRYVLATATLAAQRWDQPAEVAQPDTEDSKKLLYSV